MSKTYDLTATLNPGRRGPNAWTDDAWTNYEAGAASNVGKVGYDTYWYYATNMLFDSATLTTLRSKTITSITLDLAITKGSLNNVGFYIGYKYNNVASGAANTPVQSWARSDNAGNIESDETSIATTTNPSITSLPAAGNTKTLTLRALPQHGLVAGPNYNYGATYVFSSATLHVTTNEVTITYNKGSYGTGSAYTDVITPGGSLRGVTYTRTGYTQDGWSTNSNGSTKDYILSATYSGSSNLTLYPHWKANTYTVSYNANGGSSTPSSQTKTYGIDLTLRAGISRTSSSATYTVTYNGNGGNTPTAGSATKTTSYTFSKWNTKADGTGTAYNASGTYTANAAATMYAQWTSSTSTTSVTLPSCTRSGYTFNGWYTASSGGTKIGNAGASYTPSASVTLYAQWTAAGATLSSVTSSVDCGNNLTGSWTSTGSSYKYWLKITCGNAAAKWSSPYVSGAAGDVLSTTVQVPTDWYSMSNGPLKSTTSATATCTLYTYASDGTTVIGTSSKTFTVTVPSTVKPDDFTITESPSTTSAVVEGWGPTVFVQGYSKVTLRVSGVDWHGAALKTISMSGPGLEYTSTSSLTSTESDVVSRSGNVVYTVTITDTRGRFTTVNHTVYFEAYAAPNIAGIVIGRTDDIGNDNNGSGTYLKVKPTYSISTVDGNNSIQAQSIQYTLHGNSTVLGSIDPCASGTTYKMTGTNWPVATTNAYDVTVTVSDELNTTTYTTTLPSVQGIWYGKGNDRLGLGGVPSGPGLQVDWRIHEIAGAWVHESHAGGGSTGYIKLATLVIGSNIIGWPIKLDLSQKGGMDISSLVICFANETNTDPALSIFTKAGNVSAYLYKQATSTWDLYVEKTHITDYICVTGFQFPHALDGYVEWTWGDTFASSLPSGAVEATKSDQELKYYVDQTASNYTIGSNNYVAVSYPSGLNGNNVVGISLYTWTSNSGPFTIMPYGTTGASWYIIGASGTTINGAKFRYWYID